METRPKLTLDVFFTTITILFLIVGQLSLLVCLILTHVPIIPIIIRQFRSMLRINGGLVLIKEPACEVGKGSVRSQEKGGGGQGEREGGGIEGEASMSPVRKVVEREFAAPETPER